MRMIPSRGMMQAYLEAMSPSTTPKPVYRFGISTLRGLHKTLKLNGRDLFQSFKFLPEYLPTMVDKFPVAKRYAEAELHDFYHQMTITHIPLNERELLNIFADKLLSIAVAKEERNKFASAFAAAIIDMEHVEYAIPIQNDKASLLLPKAVVLDPKHRFWKSLEICIAKAKIFLKDPLKNEDYEETRDALIQWILEDEFGFNSNYHLILDAIQDYKPGGLDLIDANHFSSDLQETIHQKLLKELSEKAPADLLILYSSLNPNTVRGRILNSFIMGRMDLGVEELPIYSIQEFYCFAQKNSHSDCYQSAMDLFHFIIVKNLIDKFDDHLSSGFFEKLKKHHSEAFVWLMQRINPDSEHYDCLLNLAIKHGEKSRFLFNSLYSKKEANRDFSSDKTTPLHRALAAEDMELMMKLTNDGAKVVDPLTYSVFTPKEYFELCPSMCPLERSFLHGRTELSSLLYFAHKNGAGWMERNPEVVVRFRRLAAIYSQKFPDLNQDKEWSRDLESTIPKCFYSEKLNKPLQEIYQYGEYEQNFFKKLKEDGHCTPDTEAVEKLVRLRKWREKGGVLTEIELPKFNP